MWLVWLLWICGCCGCSRRDHEGTVFMSTKSDELCKGALDGEELFTIEAPKTGAQSRDNPEEREKWPKKTENPSSPP